MIQALPPKFTHHNIDLGNGKQTIPGVPPLTDDPRVKIMVGHLNILFPNPAARKNVVIADLGPQEGGHAAILWAMGFRVFLLEARKDNVAKLLWLRAQLGAMTDDFTIVLGDVRCLTSYNTRFGAIICMGLLYHLDEPARTLYDMMGLTDHIILSTHYAHPGDRMYDSFFNVPWLCKAICKRLPILFPKKHYGLGYLAKNEGVRGRWYHEFGKKDNPEKLLLSSWGNRRSFWICRMDLLRIFQTRFWNIHQAYNMPHHDIGLFLCDKMDV